MVGLDHTAESLIHTLYPALRETAARLLRRERHDHTLQRTALVHETVIRLLGRLPDKMLSDECFLALAAHQMRLILIDYARKHRSKKRGGEFDRVPFLEGEHFLIRDEETFLTLNEALERLGRLDARALSVVELKFFSGFTNAETAAILGVSDGTVEADWQFARAWLYSALAAKSVK